MKLRGIARLIAFATLIAVIAFGSPMASAHEKSQCKKTETACCYRVAWRGHHQHGQWTSQENAEAILKAVRMQISVNFRDYWMQAKKGCRIKPSPRPVEKH